MFNIKQLFTQNKDSDISNNKKSDCCSDNDKTESSSCCSEDGKENIEKPKGGCCG